MLYIDLNISFFNIIKFLFVNSRCLLSNLRFAKLLDSLKARQEILDDLSQRMDALREIEALTSSLKELEPQLETKVTGANRSLDPSKISFFKSSIMQMRSISIGRNVGATFWRRKICFRSTHYSRRRSRPKASESKHSTRK